MKRYNNPTGQLTVSRQKRGYENAATFSLLTCATIEDDFGEQLKQCAQTLDTERWGLPWQGGFYQASGLDYRVITTGGMGNGAGDWGWGSNNYDAWAGTMCSIVFDLIHHPPMVHSRQGNPTWDP